MDAVHSWDHVLLHACHCFATTFNCRKLAYNKHLVHSVLAVRLHWVCRAGRSRWWNFCDVYCAVLYDHALYFSRIESSYGSGWWTLHETEWIKGIVNFIL